MNMKKNFLKKSCCFAAVLAMLTFTACGGSTNDTSASNDNAGNAAVESTEAAQNAETAEKEEVSVVSKETQYDLESGEVTAIVEYEYDEAGNRTQTTKKDVAGTVIEITKMECNAEGRVEKAVTTDTEGNVKSTVEYTFPDDKHETATNYDAEGNVLYTNSFEFDEQGNAKKVEVSIGDMLSTTDYENTYEGDKLVKATMSSNGEAAGYTDYEYDENDALVKQTNYASDGSVWSLIEYTNDENGNCVSSKTYSGEKLSNEKEYIVITK